MITIDDYEVFCRRSFAGVLAVVDRLSDELINERPVLTGGSSPFALVTHLLGACEYWVGHMVLGEESQRVRDEEFHATGSVADLHEAIGAWLDLLGDRKSRLADASTLHAVPNTQTPLQGEWTVGAAMIHAYEELAQHLGHLEVTADMLLAPDARRAI